MGYAEKFSVTPTTDASGDATSYSAPITGRIHSIIYTKTDYASGVDFAITTESTNQGLWTESNVDASATVAPRQPTHDLVGAASLYAAAGEGVETEIVLVNERVEIVIASGGNTKSGTFVINVI